ncbi:MAG: glycosyl hydrolase family protein [Bacteroidetes bacterium]|nr:MAG: glycosyl hydrolase family protein [Bacteroidota bacterium]
MNKGLVYFALVFGVIGLHQISFGQSSSCEKIAVFMSEVPNCQEFEYKLVFEDNFDGNELDMTKWGLPYQGVDRDFDHNLEKEWYSNTGNSPFIPLENNVQVSNGTLKIIARKEKVTGSFWNWSNIPATFDTEEFDYTSAQIYTKEKFFYGRYEVRCRLPVGQGFWPAFWSYGGPTWNEIDFFEMYGDDMNRFTCNVHYDFDGDGDSENCPFASNNVADFSQWHTISCEFGPTKIEWYIDGQKIRTLHRYSTLNGQPVQCGDNIANGTYFAEQSFPNDEMGIILNLAIQAKSNQPDESVAFPQQFEVDYVRFYERRLIECDDCIDHYTYSNTNYLPPLTRAEKYIEVAENVFLPDGLKAILSAPQVTISNSFSSGVGSELLVKNEACDIDNYEESDIVYRGNNAIEDYIIDYCKSFDYRIKIVGATEFTVNVYDLAGKLVSTKSGEINANEISVWKGNNVASGWYKVVQSLKNCSEEHSLSYNLYVFQQDCFIVEDEKPGKEQEYQLASTGDPILQTNDGIEGRNYIYPNPTKGIFNLLLKQDDHQDSEIQFRDIRGNILSPEAIQIEKTGQYTLFQIDCSNLPNGVYFVHIKGTDKKQTLKLILSHD